MRLAATALLVALAACAPHEGDGYENAMGRARTAYEAGRFDAAATSFDEAAKAATIKRDVAFARYEAALARGRAGDIAESAKELRQLASENTEYSDRAAMSAAELALRSDEAAGYQELESVCLRFPDSAQAKVALERIVRHDDDAKALAFLDALRPKIAGKALEEDVVYERAKRLAALGRADDAKAAFLEVASRWPYPKGPYFDDALYRAAELDRAAKRPEDAIAELERLLSFREHSSTIGSYERPKYVPAVLLIADIQEKDLGDRAAARSTYHRLYRDFTTSTERDDALWKEAALWAKDNDASTACDRLATLAHDFPDSRYVPCAAERCPAVKRDAKSKAPATCHAYLTRE